MKNPIFLDWNNDGDIGPADIAVSYSVAESEREEPQSDSASIGCLTAISILAAVPVVAFAIMLAFC